MKTSTSANEISSTIDERSLALAFQNGEKGAYQAIYDRYSQRVQRICYRMLGSKDLASEATQETFLRVFQALPRFNGRYQLSAWISRIATNVCLDQLRAKARHPYTVAELDEARDEPASGSSDEDPQAIYIKRTESRRVRRVLFSLPPLHRAAIVLRDFEGLSYQEIASALSLTESQVKALIHRARRNFKQRWTSAGLAALLPSRLLHRLAERGRGVETAFSEHAAQALSSSTPALCLCSGALHQFGQSVAAPLARGAAALVIGTAAMAGVPAAKPQVPTRVDAAAHQSMREKRIPVQREVRSTPSQRLQASVDQPVDETPGPAPSTPPKEETPQGEPSPTPEPSPTASAEPPAENSQPDPPPTDNKSFVPRVGFDRGSGVGGTVLLEHKSSVDCTKETVSQQLRVELQDQGSTFPGTLVLSTGSSVSFELTVVKDNAQVVYRGGGGLVSRALAGNTLSLKFSGSYGSGGPAAQVGLPPGGSFSVDLSIDCSKAALLSETLALKA